MKHFYDTLNLSAEQLQKATARALAQEDFVREVFKANPNIKLSPSQIQKVASKKYDRNCPLTSWRRAITNLTSMNFLEKTSDKVTGEFGLPEHQWKLSESTRKDVVRALPQPELF